jgi:hypothetical protein
VSESPQRKDRQVPDCSVTSAAAPIDVEEVRRTYDAVLWDPVAPERRAELAGLLRGHIGLLVDEVDAHVPAMTGGMRGAAEHVLAQARRALRPSARECEEDRMQDVATVCRALLTLYEQHQGATTP